MSRYGEDVYTSGFIWMKEGDLTFGVFPSVVGCSFMSCYMSCDGEDSQT